MALPQGKREIYRLLFTSDWTIGWQTCCGFGQCHEEVFSGVMRVPAILWRSMSGKRPVDIIGFDCQFSGWRHLCRVETIAICDSCWT